MNPTEVVFLAVGLVLGVTVGAVLVAVFRSRPARRREVRVTVSPNSISVRRASTLATPERTAAQAPAAGSPAADASGTATATSSAAPATTPRPPRPVMAPETLPPDIIAARIGTSVPAAPGGGATPTSAGASARVVVTPRPVQMARPMAKAAAGSAAPSGGILAVATAPVAVAPAPPAPVPTAAPVVTTTPTAPAEAPSQAIRVRPAGPVAAAPVALPEDAVPVRIVAEAATPASSAHVEAARRGTGTTGAPVRPSPGTRPAAQPAAAAPTAGPSDPCTGLRLLADERCELATAARGQASSVAGRLAEARHAYDMLRQRVDEEERLADAREIRAAKDAAHQAYREARSGARSAKAAEAAVREWLATINRLNTVAAAAARSLDLDRAELRRLLPSLERLAVEADAARIAAESAEAGCREARESLATCEESGAGAPAKPVDPEPEPAPGWPDDRDDAFGGPMLTNRRRALAGDPVPPRILRILRGDRGAREALVSLLAGSDPDDLRRWRLVLADLVDAIVARAIEDGYLEVNETHPFWGVFERPERRDIVAALSAIGFRFDGLGGFADDRIPSMRDLSLAVGYAGIDRMRVRTWPREEELLKLFSGATVAADEWLAAQASDLALGRMIDALGNRSGELADAWNAWGRVRPALMSNEADPPGR